jgi:hypothetical protein
MKKQYILLAALLCIGTLVSAQTSTPAPVQVVEMMYLIPKRGMEEKFETAVKAHNQKFHPDGPYVAGLRKVEYGKMSGWYVWIFGPTTYSSIDTRPDKENGHAADWDATVDPLVEKYGTSELWNYNSDLSFGMDLLKKANFAEFWKVDLKPGEYYRFKGIAEKVRKASEAVGTMSFVVLENQIHQTNGSDVGLAWSFNSFKEWSEDAGMMAAFEKIYGQGTWQNMLNEWRDIVVDYDVEIRKILK